jgi:hypothetical protein
MASLEEKLNGSGGETPSSRRMLSIPLEAHSIGLLAGRSP